MKRFIRYFISFTLAAAMMISILPFNVLASSIPPPLGNVNGSQMQPGDSSKDSVYVHGTIDFSGFTTITDIAALVGEGFYFGCVTCAERMGVLFVTGTPAPDIKQPVPGYPGSYDTIVEISIDGIQNGVDLIAKIIAVISPSYIMRKGTMTASPRTGRPDVLVISHIYTNQVGNADWGFLRWGTNLREDLPQEDEDLVVPGKGLIVPGMTYELTADASGNYAVSYSGYKTDAGEFLYYIDISTDPETIVIPSDYNMTKYSIDGGRTWIWSGKEHIAKKIPKLLDKGMTLWLSDEVINLKSLSYQKITQIRFNEIKERPKLDKVIANYFIYRDQSGATTGRWVLANKGSTVPLDMTGIEVGVINGNQINFWGVKFNNNNGEPVLSISSESKSEYSIRTAPKHNGDGTLPPTSNTDGTYTAASKSQKITVLSEVKPPKYKANYKTETIKLKKGDIIFAGTNLGVAPIPLGNKTTAVLNSGEALYANEKAVIISLSDYLSVNPETVMIWSAATEKKPASAKYVYSLAPRAVMSAATPTSINGKITLSKTYEVLKDNNKWSSGLPKITASGDFSIRLKSTVKAVGGVETGFAASKPGKIHINYGIYDTVKNKSGIIDATITPAP